MPALIALALALAGPLRAWDQHRQVTALALSGLPALDRPVKAETLAAFLKATGLASSEKEYLALDKLNQSAYFAFKAGEAEGSTVSLRAVIARYSDEPDWGIDQELFDQYPELWKDDYQYMSGRTGYQSRVFRHMFWPGGFFKPAPPPRRFPIHDPDALGEAPQRAALFLARSREAFRAGHPYWGARFLGWSLHYLEDLTQPFHAVQLPSLTFLRFKPDGSLDVELSARVVAYYHLAVDAFPGKAEDGVLGAAARDRLRGALAEAGITTPFPGAAQLCETAAEESSRQAEETGARGMGLFPEPAPADLADPLGRVYSPPFWEELAAAPSSRPAQYEAFLEQLEAVLRLAGPKIRAMTVEAVSAMPKPSPRRPRRLAPQLQLLLKTASDRWLPFLQGARPFAW